MSRLVLLVALVVSYNIASSSALTIQRQQQQHQGTKTRDQQHYFLQRQAKDVSDDEPCKVRCQNMIRLLEPELLSKAATITLSNDLGTTELR